MNPPLATEQRDRLHHLLTQMAGRLDGAVDFWTTVCLSPALPGRRAFLTANVEGLRGLVAETRGMLSASAPLADPLAVLAARCEDLGNAFLTLGRFESLAPDELRRTTTAIAEVYRDLRSALLEVGRAAGVPLSYWEGQRAQREEYYRGILERLYGLCVGLTDSEKVTDTAARTR